MNISEVTNILKTLSWSVSRDEVGDQIAYFRLPDRVADIVYGLKKLRDKRELWVMRSASTDCFSDACAAVDPRRKGFTPLLSAGQDLRFQAPAILEEHIHLASEEAISWANEQNLEKALQDYATLPTNSPGSMPILHLDALALLGDMATLNLYQKSFAAGERLGFVNYITKEHLDRAVRFASSPPI